MWGLPDWSCLALPVTSGRPTKNTLYLLPSRFLTMRSFIRINSWPDRRNRFGEGVIKCSSTLRIPYVSSSTLDLWVERQKQVSLLRNYRSNDALTFVRFKNSSRSKQSWPHDKLASVSQRVLNNRYRSNLQTHFSRVVTWSVLRQAHFRQTLWSTFQS